MAHQNRNSQQATGTNQRNVYHVPAWHPTVAPGTRRTAYRWHVYRHPAVPVAHPATVYHWHTLAPGTGTRGGTRCGTRAVPQDGVPLAHDRWCVPPAAALPAIVSGPSMCHRPALRMTHRMERQERPSPLRDSRTPTRNAHHARSRGCPRAHALRTGPGRARGHRCMRLTREVAAPVNAGVCARNALSDGVSDGGVGQHCPTASEHDRERKPERHSVTDCDQIRPFPGPHGNIEWSADARFNARRGSPRVTAMGLAGARVHVPLHTAGIPDGAPDGAPVPGVVCRWHTAPAAGGTWHMMCRCVYHSGGTWYVAHGVPLAPGTGT